MPSCQPSCGVRFHLDGASTQLAQDNSAYRVRILQAAQRHPLLSVQLKLASDFASEFAENTYKTTLRSPSCPLTASSCAAVALLETTTLNGQEPGASPNLVAEPPSALQQHQWSSSRTNTPMLILAACAVMGPSGGGRERDGQKRIPSARYPGAPCLVAGDPPTDFEGRRNQHQGSSAARRQGRVCPSRPRPRQPQGGKRGAQPQARLQGNRRR